MTSEEREAWLASLQVGDKVYYHSRWHGIVITEIEKITPTRQIKTEDGKTFKKGRYSIDYESYSINPVTEEIIEKVEFSLLVKRFKEEKFENYTLERLRQVASLLDEVAAE